MQSYDESNKIVNASAGPLAEMKNLAAEEIEREKVARVVLAKLPAVGSLVEVNGLVFEVKFVAPGRGKVQLQLKGFVRENDKVSVQIIVNWRPQEIVGQEYITYENIVALANFPGTTNPTVTYGNGSRHNRSGIMEPGSTRRLVNGMVFNVADTGAA